MPGFDGTDVTKAESGSMTLQQFSEVKCPGADLTDFIFDVQYEITSFNMTVELENDYTKVIKSTSSEITKDMRKLVETMNQGQTVCFGDIKAVGPDGIIRTLNPIIVKVIS